MSSAELFINGELLRLGRETRGWSLNDMATRSCMSVKQIRQLEEGGMSCFYSEAVKLTAAKKVGVLLGVSLDALFAREPEPTPEPESIPEDADMQDKPVADVEVTVSVDTARESVIDQLDAVVHAVVPEKSVGAQNQNIFVGDRGIVCRSFGRGCLHATQRGACGRASTSIVGGSF